MTWESARNGEAEKLVKNSDCQRRDFLAGLQQGHRIGADFGRAHALEEAARQVECCFGVGAHPFDPVKAQIEYARTIRALSILEGL